MSVDLGSVPDWLGLFVAVLSLGGGSVVTSYANEALSRSRFEDRRRLLGVVSPVVDAPQHLRSTVSRWWGAHRASGTVDADTWAWFETWTSGLRQIEGEILPLLPWTDRAGWALVRETLPMEWQRSIQIVSDYQELMENPFLQQHEKQQRLGRGGFRSDWLPILDLTEPFGDWYEPFQHECIRFRQYLLGFVNPTFLDRLYRRKLRFARLAWRRVLSRRAIERRLGAASLTSGGG